VELLRIDKLRRAPAATQQQVASAATLRRIDLR